MRPAIQLAQIIFVIQKATKSAKIIFGKMPITACNAAMSTVAVFLNAQTMLAIQKTRSGATTWLGIKMIIAHIAEIGIYHAE